MIFCRLGLLLLLVVAFVAAQPIDSFWEGVRKILFRDIFRKKRRQPPPAIQPEPMLVIGAGLPRTGTGSLQRALSILGYKTYHMMAVLEDGEHARRWADLARGEVHVNQTFKFLGEVGYNASLDHPTSDFFLEQMQLYPDAKVLLSVRDSATAWARSFKVLTDLVLVMERPVSLLYPNPLPLFLPQKVFDIHDVRCLMGTAALGLKPCELIFGEHDEQWLEEQYERHNAYVRDTVPPERLLEFNVKEGWEPLCEFLRVPVPTNVPFPRLGESAMLRRAGVILQFITYAWIPFILLSLWMMLNRCYCRSNQGRRRRSSKRKQS